MSEYIVALTTCPPEKSEELARILVEHKVCACVNIVTNVRSIYHWKNEIVSDDEVILIMKTQDDYKDTLWKVIKDNHPYEVPEYVVVSINWGSKDYLDWITDSIT
jgi:periplasmic divalent cation tolerance protein